MPAEPITDALRTRLGPGAVLTEPEDMAPFLVGPRRTRGQCLAVVRPSTVADVSETVRMAASEQVPVVPLGGNTGLCDGGISTDPRAIVVSLSRLNRIREIDRSGYSMTIEAGVILADAQRAAAEAGLLLPLGLGAEGSCQIGGNLATNAGGRSVVRYGMLREQVLGLEVVLADGRIWSGLTNLRKNNAGYDLKQLFIGSEGTLGIITAAVLRLLPAVRRKATAMAAVAGPEHAIALLDRLRRATGDQVTAFEIMNAYALNVAVRHVPRVAAPFADAPDWSAIIELSSPRADEDLDGLIEAVLTEALEDGLITDALIARSETQTGELWRMREEGTGFYWKEGGFVLHDPSVPIAQVPGFIDAVTVAVEAVVPGARIALFGHMGDGNIHVIVSQPEGADKHAFLAHAAQIQDAVYGAAVDLGGSFSAEHGIGRLKISYLRAFRSALDVELMAALKGALDPRGIMNPGALLSPADRA